MSSSKTITFSHAFTAKRFGTCAVSGFKICPGETIAKVEIDGQEGYASCEVLRLCGVTLDQPETAARWGMSNDEVRAAVDAGVELIVCTGKGKTKQLKKLPYGEDNYTTGGWTTMNWRAVETRVLRHAKFVLPVGFRWPEAA